MYICYSGYNYQYLFIQISRDIVNHDNKEFSHPNCFSSRIHITKFFNFLPTIAERLLAPITRKYYII